MDDRSKNLRRLGMRSWRRGMKEMDLILGPFSDRELAAQSDDFLSDYEALLEENDQDLYSWIVARGQGEKAGPERFSAVLDAVATSAWSRLRRD
ncbi:MAG: succinate dehydrogenase assembly factor 2 [Paracoccus sp. (in: a-proteobacteria)]|nr:succinate dehydrogenase assembly factor 2 [Paracoccus sp. (in: a-proteobacteria)]